MRITVKFYNSASPLIMLLMSAYSVVFYHPCVRFIRFRPESSPCESVLPKASGLRSPLWYNRLTRPQSDVCEKEATF